MTVNKKRDSDVAYEKIKDMIIRGQVAQGDVVSVLYFSELLELGRMPVTVACQKLEVDGFLQIIPKQGVLINPVSINDARELYEARLCIETFMAEHAFDNLTEDDVHELEESIQRQNELFRNSDPYGFMEEDTKFHRYILKRHPNSILMNMHHTMTDRIFFIGVKNSEYPARMQQSIEDHKAMVAAIRSHDKERFLAAVASNQISGLQFVASNVTPVLPLK